jgi:hypothetical protein
MDELLKQWYQAGTLLVQAGFLVAGVWSVRTILKNMRASQEQMGALLKLTVSAGGGEENLPSHPRATPYLLDGWPESAQNTVPAASLSQSAVRQSGMWSGVATWLHEPMVRSGINPWRRAVRWLQAPAGT